MKGVISIILIFVFYNSYGQLLHVECDTIISSVTISQPHKFYDNQYKIIGYADGNTKDFPHSHIVNIFDGENFKAEYYTKLVFNIENNRIAFFETENLPQVPVAANHRLRLKEYDGKFISLKTPIVTKNIFYDLVKSSRGRFIAVYSDSITSEGTITCIKKNGSIAWTRMISGYSDGDRGPVIPTLNVINNDKIILLSTLKVTSLPQYKRSQEFYFFNARNGKLLKKMRFDLTTVSRLSVNVFHNTDSNVHLINDSILISVDISTMDEKTRYHSVPKIYTEAKNAYIIGYSLKYDTFIILDKDSYSVMSFNEKNGCVSRVFLEPIYFAYDGVKVLPDEIVFQKLGNRSTCLCRIFLE